MEWNIFPHCWNIFVIWKVFRGINKKVEIRETTLYIYILICFAFMIFSMQLFFACLFAKMLNSYIFNFFQVSVQFQFVVNKYTLYIHVHLFYFALFNDRKGFSNTDCIEYFYLPETAFSYWLLISDVGLRNEILNLKAKFSSSYKYLGKLHIVMCVFCSMLQSSKFLDVEKKQLWKLRS